MPKITASPRKRSIPELLRRPPIRNTNSNLTDDQKHLRTSRTPTMQTDTEEESQQNSDNESEYSDNDSINSSQQEDDDSKAGSEVQENQEDQESVRRRNTEEYGLIPESAVIPDLCSGDNRGVPKTAGNVRQTEPKKIKNKIPSVVGSVIVVVSFITVGILATRTNLSPKQEKLDLTIIKESFLTQDDDLWDAFESGVEDVVTRRRPSTFILLYEQKAEQILKNIVAQLSKYAACRITDCNRTAIEITDAELNSPEVVREYGTVIQRYKPRLEEQGVMIVKNLENVQGVSAQAFHAFCDEFTPLVEKSLFIFTVRVDRLPESSDRMKFIEEYLKSKWTDVKVDTLNALITRITSMVLEVRA